MKVFNKLFNVIALSLMFFGISATANAQITLSADSVSVLPDGEATVTVNYESTEEKSGFQLDITLPEGLSFVTTEGVDEDDEPISFIVSKGEGVLNSHSITETMQDAETNKVLRVIVYHDKKKNLKNGSLISFKVKAASNFDDAQQITFSGIKFNGDAPVADFTCVVVKETATGINGVESTNNQASKIYNINGVEVSKNHKGLVIVNGKKVVK